MITVDSSLTKFIQPEIFSFLTDLEAAVLEHGRGDPLQMVAEYITETDMSGSTRQEILASLNVSYETMLVLKASVDADRNDPNYSSEVRMRIEHILEY